MEQNKVYQPWMDILRKAHSQAKSTKRNIPVPCGDREILITEYSDLNEEIKKYAAAIGDPLTGCYKVGSKSS